MGKMTKTWNYYMVHVSANKFRYQVVEGFTRSAIEFEEEANKA